MRYLLLIPISLLVGCSIGNASREVVSPVESSAASTPVIAVQPELSSLIPQVKARVVKTSVAPIVWPTNTITGDGVVGFTIWNGHVVPYVQNTGVGNIHANQSIAYGQFTITDVEDVYYSKRVAVFDSEDPTGVGHNYNYILWGSQDLNSHCWVQLDCRCSYGPRVELFDTQKQSNYYRVTRE